MSLLTIADSFYIGALDLATATSWYIERLGLQKVRVEMDDAEGCVALGFPKRIRQPLPSGLAPNRLMEWRPCYTLPTSRRQERSWVLAA